MKACMQDRAQWGTRLGSPWGRQGEASRFCAQGLPAGSYLGSKLRMRQAGLVSDSRSRFTGHPFSWGQRSGVRVCGKEPSCPSPPGAGPHPAAHDVPEGCGWSVCLHSVLTRVGQRDPEASVEEGGPRGWEERGRLHVCGLRQDPRHALPRPQALDPSPQLQEAGGRLPVRGQRPPCDAHLAGPLTAAAGGWVCYSGWCCSAGPTCSTGARPGAPAEGAR